MVNSNLADSFIEVLASNCLQLGLVVGGKLGDDANDAIRLVTDSWGYSGRRNYSKNIYLVIKIPAI